MAKPTILSPVLAGAAALELAEPEADAVADAVVDTHAIVGN